MKSSRFFVESRPDKEQEEPLNDLEYFILSAIIKSLQNDGVNKVEPERVSTIFNNIVDLISENHFLCLLPIFKKTVQVIKKQMEKIERRKKTARLIFQKSN